MCWDRGGSSGKWMEFGDDGWYRPLVLKKGGGCFENGLKREFVFLQKVGGETGRGRKQNFETRRVEGDTFAKDEGNSAEEE